MIRVVLADDDELVRTGIRLMIQQTPDIEVIAEAPNGAEAVRLAVRERPDVVLMDVRMPEMNGIEATAAITERTDDVRVMMLTTFELDDYVFEALQAGASGFLLKRNPPETLLDGIRTIAAGEGLLSPSVTRRLIEAFASSTAALRSDPRLDLLTERELEVLRHMALGKSNTELADELFISDNTVKTHVKRVLTKLGARDRAQAVVIAYQGGLMD